MHNRQDLLERNRPYAETFTGGELPIQPRYRQLVMSCVDSRADPAHYLGLQPGDALVMRTLGGRVTDGAEQDIAVLANLMTAMGGPDGPRLEVLIVHHTDCGLERLSDEERRSKISQGSGIDDAVFDFIEGFYNPLRRHSSIEDLPPIEFERKFRQGAGVATPGRTRRARSRGWWRPGGSSEGRPVGGAAQQ